MNIGSSTFPYGGIAARVHGIARIHSKAATKLAMLTREGQKKFTNLSTVTLKQWGRKYEVAVYPNKLYEYRQDPSTPLSTILHTDQIYKNMATGDLCSSLDLAPFQMDDRESIIKCILDNGHEQKAHATSQYELETVERQIVEMVQNKVLYNGHYVPAETLLGFIRGVWDIRGSNPKKQISSIIRRLEEIGFERISYRIKCDTSRINFQDVQLTDDGVIVKSDLLPEFLSYCDDESIQYVVEKNEEAESEEIC